MNKLQEEALRSQLGKRAKFWLYERDKRTPMNFVLDEVEQQIGPRFSVYWVDGGSPEVFTLSSSSRSPVVFSSRYLALSSVMRHLFVDGSLTNILVEVAERTTLKLMAEMALRSRNPEFAVLAFVKSVMVSNFRLPDDEDEGHVQALESEPINEAYMATWFYGLVHELGHLSPIQTQYPPDNHPFSDTWISDAIVAALDLMPYPASLKHEAIERAKQKGSSFVLEINRLRSEGLADFFAASILFQTTLDIMQKVNQKKFEVVRFIGEMLIFLNIITIIDRCRRVAAIASATIPNPDAHIENALHPIAVMVRLWIQRVYLESAVAEYVFDTTRPDREQVQRVEKFINDINQSREQQIALVDSGLARAMEFSLFPERRENTRVLLEAFPKKLRDSPGFDLLEARRFCTLADSLDLDSNLLKALNDIVAHR
jgi:hypothetical protein